MPRIFPYFLLLSVLTLLVSCGIPSLTTPEKRQLVIASDFLNHKDRSLFKAFAQEFNTEIHILNLSSDSILNKIKREGYSTRIDMVILRSSLDFCALDEKNLLQRVIAPEERPDLPYRLRSKDFNWFGLAIDPYIVIQGRDSTKRISNYSDLSEVSSWTTELTKGKDLEALVTPMLHRIRNDKKKNTYTYLESFFNAETSFRRPGDSTYYFPPLLTRYSDFFSDSILYRSGYRNGKTIFPGQNSGGIYYELRGAGIVRQARNYSAALDFLKYFTEERNNEKLNNWWNTFPVNRSMDRAFTYQNKRFKMYPVAQGDLCDLRKEADRLIRKVRKNKKANL